MTYSQRDTAHTSYLICHVKDKGYVFTNPILQKHYKKLHHLGHNGALIANPCFNTLEKIAKELGVELE